MPVTNVNAGATVGNTGIASLTLTAFSAVGADFILVGVSQWRASDVTPTATFNGSQNFTVHAQQTLSDGAGVRRCTVFKLVAPAQVAGDIVVSWAGSVDEAVIGATAWSGVDQTAPLGTAVINTSAGGVDTLSVNVTAPVGSVTHDSYSGSADSVLAAATNQTLRWSQWAAFKTTEGGGASAAGTGSPVTHTWSGIGSGGNLSLIRIVLIGVPIQQVQGPVPVIPGRKTSRAQLEVGTHW